MPPLGMRCASNSAPLLFRVDAEWIHDRAVRAAEVVGKAPVVCTAVENHYAARDPWLEVDGLGMRMASPIGLGAGFDKNGRAVPALGGTGIRACGDRVGVSGPVGREPEAEVVPAAGG